MQGSDQGGGAVDAALEYLAAVFVVEPAAVQGRTREVDDGAGAPQGAGDGAQARVVPFACRAGVPGHLFEPRLATRLSREGANPVAFLGGIGDCLADDARGAADDQDRLLHPLILDGFSARQCEVA